MILANRLMGHDTVPSQFLFAPTYGTEKRLCCIDVTIPSAMRIISEYTVNDVVDEYIHGMTIDPDTDTLYAGTWTGVGNESIHAIDISNKGSMTRKSRFTHSSYSNSAWMTVDSTNKILYAASQVWNPDLFSLDVSDPDNITLIDTWTATSGDIMYGTPALDAARGNLYAAGKGPSDFDRYGAFSFNISSAGAINLISVFTNTTTLVDVQGSTLDPAGQVLYVVGRGAVANQGYIASFDVSTPSSITLIQIKNLANLAGPQMCSYSSVHDAVFVCASYADKITAVDVSNPADMLEISAFGDASVEIPWPLRLSDDEQTLFYGDWGTKTIFALDISNPSAMTGVGELQDDRFSLTDMAYIEYVY